MNDHVKGLNTKLNHPKKQSPGPGNPPTVAPIYQSVKFVVNQELAYGDQYIYTRISNPTLRTLELTLAEIQKKEDCLVFASGIAAITNTFLGLLKLGDHVITFRELYKPARVFVRDLLPKWGIESTLLSLSDLDQLENAITPKTKLIHFESPSNPNLELADIERILAIAKKHKILVSMDGTFGGLHQHTEFDVDLMIHSLTKYANGHGDVLAGSVAGKAKLIGQIRSMAIFVGATLDPHAAFLIDRGLKTYLLRYERQTQNAQMVAEWLAQHPRIKKVYYPGLPEHRNHALAKKQMKHMGAMVSFELDGIDADHFAHNLKLIQFAVSLGSTETLIAPTHFFFGDDLSETDRRAMGINKQSIRLSVGIEDVDDIIRDLAEGLASA